LSSNLSAFGYTREILDLTLVPVTNACADSSTHIGRSLAGRHTEIRALDLSIGGWGRAVRAGLADTRGDLGATHEAPHYPASACAVRHNLPMSRDRIRPQEAASSSTPEEAAAIVAAIERFMRATTPPPAAGEPARFDDWRTAAVVEGVSREPRVDVGDAWLSGG
jgi:hypothetical protein